MGTSCTAQGTPLLALGWPQWEGKKGLYVHGYICTWITDSLCCTGETNTTLWSNYASIRIN